jgi:hypothetical protein
MEASLAEIDDCLDDAAFRFHPLWKYIDHLFERSAVRDPWPRIDSSLFNQFDNPIEIRWMGIAAGKQTYLTSMHQRVRNGDFRGGNADENKASGKRGVV